jgi:hypothetical protein
MCRQASPDLNRSHVGPNAWARLLQPCCFLKQTSQCEFRSAAAALGSPMHSLHGTTHHHVSLC